MDMYDTVSEVRPLLDAALPGLTDGLFPGTSEEEVSAAEVVFGQSLPEELRRYFRYGGCPDWVAAALDEWNVYYFSDLETSVHTWRGWNEIDDPTDRRPEWPIQWDASWIPIAHAGNGDSLCYRLDERDVLVHLHDSPARDPLFGSLEEMLDRFREAVLEGRLRFDEDEEGLDFFDEE